MKNNTKAVIKFLQANKGLDFTAQDVAQALSLDVSSCKWNFHSTSTRPQKYSVN